MRRAYRCPCAGETFPKCGEKGAGRLEGELVPIEKLTGHRPPTCPWHALYDLEVSAVLDAHDFFERGQVGEWWGDDPPLWLVRAVRAYDHFLAVCREDARRINTPKPGGLPAPKLKAGSVVQHASSG